MCVAIVASCISECSEMREACRRERECHKWEPFFYQQVCRWCRHTLRTCVMNTSENLKSTLELLPMFFFSSVDAQKCMCTERGSYCDDPLKTSTCCAFCGLLHFNQDPSGFYNDVKFMYQHGSNGGKEILCAAQKS